MASERLPKYIREKIAAVRRGESRELSLADERRQELPEEIFSLTALESLCLAGNQLRVIPEAIRGLPNLNRLDLTGNPLEDVPDIPGLVLDADVYLRLSSRLSKRNIQGLSLDVDNYSESLTPIVVGLPALMDLSINGDGEPNRSLSALIRRLNELRALRNLTISHVTLPQLPAAIEGLTKLRRLRVSSAGLLDCPAWIGELQELVELAFYNNELRALPDELERLRALLTLNLAHNRFPGFPGVVVKLSWLKHLNLAGGSPIRQIPAAIQQMSALEFLDVGKHPIETPPPDVVSGGVQAIKDYWRQERRGRRVYVSYRHSEESIAIVNVIQSLLKELGIPLHRDLDDVGYRESVRDFMKRLGSADRIVVVLSKAYLHSPNCVFELTEIAAAGDLRERIYPIVLPDAKIDDPFARLEYARYWDQRTAELQDKIEQVKFPGAQDDLNDFARYQTKIADILRTIADMNALTPERGVQALVADLKGRLTSY